MNPKRKRIVSAILCLLLILGSYSEDTLHGHMLGGYGHTETDTDQGDHDEQINVDILSPLKDVLESVQSMFVIRAYAGYEDGVECDYCGGWRYDDWKCDNGDHCGEGADGD